MGKPGSVQSSISIRGSAARAPRLPDIAMIANSTGLIDIANPFLPSGHYTSRIAKALQALSL
jgi:hypothetical protein